MKLNNLKIREKLLIRLSGGDGREFPVRVDEVKSKNFFFIDLPIALTRVIRFKPGTELDFLNIKPDGIHIFNGIVQPSDKDDNFRMKIFFVEDSYRKVQRRYFFRLELFSKCKVKNFSQFFTSQPVIDICSMNNISAGGVCFNTNIGYYVPGEHIYLTFEFKTVLPGYWCEIIESTEIEDRKFQESYKIRAKFILLTEKETESMVEFIFTKQRELLKEMKLDPVDEL
ncbi:MAG: flagellar brake domain-containing protein [Candidatus Delongbacteria bacterium]|nr:flagellar brake domain-containing protein [Candidatus Delongbacteria bacterium]MBN2833961.1 flagellar brake domain-containing protein [Candidatus Delongbacteria bacterium]